MRNRSQPFAWPADRLRVRHEALRSGGCSWSGSESVSCWLRIFFGREGVCVSDLCDRKYVSICTGGDSCHRNEIGVCGGGVCEWSVTPQFFWRLQRRCCCAWSVLPQWYWRLRRACLCEWPVSPQWYRCCAGGVCLNDLCRSSCISVCRAGVCVSDLSPELYWRFQWRRVWPICGAAVILAFADEVSVWVICGGAVILAFAEEVSLWVICVAAVILAFCTGGVCLSDLCRRSCIGVCRGGVQECLGKVSSKSVPTSVKKECETRASYKSVTQQCPAQVSYKSVKSECLTRVSNKSVFTIFTRMPTQCAYKSVLQECQVRASHKSVK